MSEVKPIEEQVIDVMKQFRSLRMKNMINNPASIEDESLVPEEIRRHAEALAIVAIVLADVNSRDRLGHPLGCGPQQPAH